jgi:hypothetical protein
MGQQAASCFSSIMTGEKADGTKLIGSWVDPRNGLDYFREEQNLLLLPGFEPQLVPPTA